MRLSNRYHDDCVCPRRDFCILVMLVIYLCDLCILLMLPSIEQKTYIVNLYINLSIQNFEGGLRILYFL